MLSHPECLDGTEPRLKTLWLWHSAEEAEHKCTAFDLYQALGGSEQWRLKWMRRVTVIFLFDTLRQTLNNLQRDGTLWRWSTWTSGARFLFGTGGMIRASIKPWRAWFQRGFHPAQQHSTLSDTWLRENASAYAVVGQRA